MKVPACEVIAHITTGSDIVKAFQDENYYRRLLEAMVWSKGRD
jgi:hypothetical protein